MVPARGLCDTGGRRNAERTDCSRPTATAPSFISSMLLLKPVLHDASNIFKRWPHDHSPHRVAVMHMSGDKCLGLTLALERFPPKVGIFDPLQRSIQRWKQVATSTWYTAKRCAMCSPAVTSFELMSWPCEVTIFYVVMFFLVFTNLYFFEVTGKYYI
jgi:hypothetical protein